VAKRARRDLRPTRPAGDRTQRRPAPSARAGDPGRAHPAGTAEFEAGLVADLRLTAARYPADRRLGAPVFELGTQTLVD